MQDEAQGQVDGRRNVKTKPPLGRPVKIVYPGDPGFEQAVADGTVASGGDMAWTEFIHDRVPAKPTRKYRPARSAEPATRSRKVPFCTSCMPRLGLV